MAPVLLLLHAVNESSVEYAPRRGFGWGPRLRESRFHRRATGEPISRKARSHGNVILFVVSASGQQISAAGTFAKSVC